MHLIPTCRPWQRQYRLWHLLATVQRELVSERTRKGRPQAHGLSPPVKRRQSQACQPEKMNPNHYSESFVWRGRGKRCFLFFCRKYWGDHGPYWVGKRLPGHWLETQIMPYSTTSWWSPLSTDCQGCQLAHCESFCSATQQKTLISYISLVNR